jgi:hypothetical protein
MAIIKLAEKWTSGLVLKCSFIIPVEDIAHVLRRWPQLPSNKKLTKTKSATACKKTEELSDRDCSNAGFIRIMGPWRQKMTVIMESHNSTRHDSLNRGKLQIKKPMNCSKMFFSCSRMIELAQSITLDFCLHEN